ncbi:hypothetical protein FRB95_013662 [Tulasnella sp. JGI-2019a]|nr:hypothetical protein FRB95_013662 [Tulasnella sp. JGI-2019a]
MVHPYGNQPGYAPYDYSQSTTPSPTATQSHFTSPTQYDHALPRSPPSITPRVSEPETSSTNNTGPSRRQRRSVRISVPKAAVATKKKSEPSNNRDPLVEPQATSSSDSYTPPRLYHFKAYDNVSSLSLDTGVLPAGTQYTYGSSSSGSTTHTPVPTPGPTSASAQGHASFNETPSCNTAKPSTAGKRVIKEVVGAGGNNNKSPENDVAYSMRAAGGATISTTRNANSNFGAPNTASLPSASAPNYWTTQSSLHSPTTESEQSMYDMPWPESGPSSPRATFGDSYAPNNHSAPHTVPYHDILLKHSSPAPTSSRRASTASFAGQFAGLEFDGGGDKPSTNGKLHMRQFPPAAQDASGLMQPGKATRRGNIEGNRPNQERRPSTHGLDLSYVNTTGPSPTSHLYGSGDKTQQHVVVVNALAGTHFNSTNQQRSPSTHLTHSPYTPPAVAAFPGGGVYKGRSPSMLQGNTASTNPSENPLVEARQPVAMSSAVLPQSYGPAPLIGGRTMRDHIMKGPVSYNVSSPQTSHVRCTSDLRVSRSQPAKQVSRRPIPMSLPSSSSQLPHATEGAGPSPQMHPQQSAPYNAELVTLTNIGSNSRRISSSSSAGPGYQLSAQFPGPNATTSPHRSPSSPPYPPINHQNMGAAFDTREGEEDYLQGWVE